MEEEDREEEEVDLVEVEVEEEDEVDLVEVEDRVISK